jgi:hypothetical protein
MNIEFGQLIINHPERAKRATRIFVSKSFPERERILGKIFGIVEIETDSPDKRKYQIIDDIINNLENSFYYHEALGDNPADLDANEIDPEVILEDTLKKTNEKIINMVQGGAIYLPTEKLHFIFGVIKDENLFFTNFGQMQAFLIFGSKNNDLKIIDIIGKRDDSSRPAEPSRGPIKFFSNIISGKLNSGNSILFTTDSLLDFLSSDRLKKTISMESARSAADDFRQILLKVTPYVTFASIILKLNNEKIVIPVQEITEPQNSIQGLISTEERTKSFLIPSLKSALLKNLISTKNYIKKFSAETKQKIKENRNEKILSQKPIEKDIESAEIETDKKAFLASYKERLDHLFKKKIDNDPPTDLPAQKDNAEKLSPFFKRKTTAIRHYLVSLKTKCSNAIKNFIHRIADNIDDRIGRLYKSFSNWPKSSRILFVASIIITLIFVQSLVYLDQQKEKKSSTIFFNQTADEIKKNLDEAEAGIIYNDEDTAKKILAKTQALLAVLPQVNKQEKTAYNELNKRFLAQLQNLKKIINIEEPSQIVNFQTLAAENSDIKIKGLININNKLYAWSDDKKTVYEIDPDKKEITEVASLNQSEPNLNLGLAIDSSSIVFIKANQSLTKLDLNTKTFSALELPLVNNAEIKDLAIYNNRLYSLDPRNNQIYRYTKTPTGYSRGAAWVKERNINLSDSVSLAIDTNIYVAKSDGSILKFNSGYASNLNTDNIDPLLKQPTKIFASTDSNFLYILDPGNKRLIVTTKDGKLKNQYYSDQFDDLNDFVVIEKEKKIYLFNGTKIFGIIASHL